MFTELDIATTAAVLKIRARRTGDMSTRMNMLLPGSRDEYWREEALRHLCAAYKAREMGKPAVSILAPARRLEQEYDELKDTGYTPAQLASSIHELDDGGVDAKQE